MTTLQFERTYAAAVPQLSLPWRAAPAPDPQLVVLNEPLARELGLEPDALRTPAGAALLTGQVAEDVETVAQAYAGHQFGMYSPRLGDGRALLLGEILDTVGRRRDLHLKGSGRTPFARGGDGRAAIGPMLREYLMGEAMHALGIPTTRALAVVTTGEHVVREGVLPGAVLTRVASSHLRVGTFQYAAAHQDLDLLRSLADYAIERHYPAAAEADEPYLALYDAVVDAQADLVANWMNVGFIHGVMNTDNMTISGETIDYGPCAFMEQVDPATVFSSIDHQGRYAYGNQPAIAQWDLARLGETLLPLLGDEQTAVDKAMGVLGTFGERYDRAAAGGMARKLGLTPETVATEPEAVRTLIQDLMALLKAHRVDFTQFFRQLSLGLAEELFTDWAPLQEWDSRRRALLPYDHDKVTEQMLASNPAYIPRNRRVEDALEAATQGDLTVFRHVLEAVTDPYTERPGFEDLLGPSEGGMPHVTYCGT
ncbi:protein adenylyltransferase SelO [Actinomycetota bacterium]